MAKNLLEKVLKTIKSYDMLKAGERVLVAVSGGPDSVFLLHALDRLKGKLRLEELVICNMDHGLRGKDSKKDSAFVERLARRMRLKIIHKTAHLGKHRTKDLSTEEAAREARYIFFKKAAQKTRSNVIATGHTLDDQAETVLMRLIKGASLKGAVGIAPVREDGRVRIIRPLLELEKDQIKEYLDLDAIAYRVDSTNLEAIYFRNIVRLDIIPFLERYNPRLKRALFNLAGHLREDFQFIEDAKRNMRLKVRGSKRGAGVLEIKLKDLVIQPAALQKEILRDALEKTGGKVKKLSFRHWKEVEGLIKHKRKGSSLDLPGGIRVTRTGSALLFSRI